MNLVQQIKENPVVSILAVFAFAMTTITGTLTATGQLDALVMTETEHNVDFVPLAERMEGVETWNRCMRHEQRLAILDDRKWKLEQAGATADAIRDVENDIIAEQRRYDALNCAQVLA